MGNGTIDVGNKSLTNQFSPPFVERLAGGGSPRIDRQNSVRTARPGNCGAMAQQGGDSGRGHQSAPQKFLRLVGFRDPKARTEPWVRPHPIPVKR